ncbi:hypothetical protein [Psychroflexus aestuariivivens]|uniref:hypothetical protein n=1 Tax=Psychroflexus aestuariivivens TaxID=1795040 RepID=UPI000FDACAEE|nr:hypothetical protein [Psychroflexus aestuariivivens]
MKRCIFILALVMSSTVAFGADSLKNVDIAEPVNTGITIRIDGNFNIGDCNISYEADVTLTATMPPEITAISGTATLGEGCIGEGTEISVEFEANAEVNSNGQITYLNTFSRNEFVASNQFAEGLRNDLNRQRIF